MKKISILALFILMSSGMAFANVNTKDMTTAQYLMNAGYSGNMAKYAELTTRDPYAPTDDVYRKDGVSILKNIWKKIDPTAFEDYNETWHEIKLTPTVSDL
jgi:hypothetical protein